MLLIDGYNVYAIVSPGPLMMLCTGVKSSKCLIIDGKALEGVSGPVNVSNHSTGDSVSTYPKNARSLLAPDVSAPTGWSGTDASSSVGKYDVSVMDLRLGTNGASISRMMSQSTP